MSNIYQIREYTRSKQENLRLEQASEWVARLDRELTVSERQDFHLWLAIDIENAKARVGDKVALQGNMDPSMLYAPLPRIEQEVSKILAGFGKGGTGHVFNLGHGIHPDVNPEHAGHFIESVHRLSKPYHK